MTAFSDLDSAVSSAFQGGAFEYLPKPFDVPMTAVDLIRRAVQESLREAVEIEAVLAAGARDAGPGPGDAGRVSRHRPAQPEHRHCAHHRRVGLGQGTGRQCAAQAQPACQRPVRGHQHRGDPERPARVGTVRPRARRLHRRPDDAARPFRAGRRRHALSRRDRRHAVRPADAPAARAGRRAVLSRRRPQPDAQQRARDRRDAPGSRRPGSRRLVSRRPVPPS